MEKLKKILSTPEAVAVAAFLAGSVWTLFAVTVAGRLP